MAPLTPRLNSIARTANLALNARAQAEEGIADVQPDHAAGNAACCVEQNDRQR